MHLAKIERPFHFEKVFFYAHYRRALFIVLLFNVLRACCEVWQAVCIYWGSESYIEFKKERFMEIFTIGFLVCMACGLACFYLFFKFVDWLEKM